MSFTTAIDYTRFPVGIALRTLLFERIFAKFEDLGIVQVGDQILRFPAEFFCSSASGSCPEGRIPYVCGSRTSRSTSWPCFHVLYPAVQLSKVVCQEFCSQRRSYRFPCNFSNRLMVPKMILRLGFADLVHHIASSILARLVAILELSEPFGKAPPSFSYIQLSQCKLQVVCCRERLHVTVFGKIASFSRERISNFTRTLYFERVSKYPCMERSLVSSSRPPSGSLL